MVVSFDPGGELTNEFEFINAHKVFDKTPHSQNCTVQKMECDVDTDGYKNSSLNYMRVDNFDGVKTLKELNRVTQDELNLKVPTMMMHLEQDNLEVDKSDEHKEEVSSNEDRGNSIVLAMDKLKDSISCFDPGGKHNVVLEAMEKSGEVAQAFDGFELRNWPKKLNVKNDSLMVYEELVFDPGGNDLKYATRTAIIMLEISEFLDAHLLKRSVLTYDENRKLLGNIGGSYYGSQQVTFDPGITFGQYYLKAHEISNTSKEAAILSDTDVYVQQAVVMEVEIMQEDDNLAPFVHHHPCVGESSPRRNLASEFDYVIRSWDILWLMKELFCAIFWAEEATAEALSTRGNNTMKFAFDPDVLSEIFYAFFKPYEHGGDIYIVETSFSMPDDNFEVIFGVILRHLISVVAVFIGISCLLLRLINHSLEILFFDPGRKRFMLDEWVLYLSTESELACNIDLVVALIQLMPKVAIIDVLKLLTVNPSVYSASKISGLDKILELDSYFIAIEITHVAAIGSAIFWDETQIQPEDSLPYFLLSNVEINQIIVLAAAGHFDSIKTSIMVFIFDPGGDSYFCFAASIVRGPSQQCYQSNYKLLGVVLISIVHNWLMKYSVCEEVKNSLWLIWVKMTNGKIIAMVMNSIPQTFSQSANECVKAGFKMDGLEDIKLFSLLQRRTHNDVYPSSLEENMPIVVDYCCLVPIIADYCCLVLIVADYCCLVPIAASSYGHLELFFEEICQPTTKASICWFILSLGYSCLFSAPVILPNLLYACLKNIVDDP